MWYCLESRALMIIHIRKNYWKIKIKVEYCPIHMFLHSRIHYYTAVRFRERRNKSDLASRLTVDLNNLIRYKGSGE